MRDMVSVLALALMLAPAQAQSCDTSQPSRTIYGLAHDGRMTINGTTSKSYASGFDIDVDVDDDFFVIIVPGGIYVDGVIEIDVDSPKELWSSLAVDGSTRFALRRDGRTKVNDKSGDPLPITGGSVWLDMVADDGEMWSVRSDGLVLRDEEWVADHPSDGFAFRRILRDADDVYVLRSDGTVYRNAESSPVLQFEAGPGDLGLGDGLTVETTWIAMAREPGSDLLYALRCDGHVHRGTVAPGDDEEEVVALPYDRFDRPYVGQLFVDIAFGPDGTWYALSGDGRVYTADATLAPLVDLPGNASQSGRVFVDVETIGDDWYALRSDGRVYENGDDEQLYDLAGEAYGSLALSDESPPPVQDGAKKPKITIVKTKTVVGTPLRVPVVVTDADTCSDELVVTPVEPLPPGATWDAEGLALVWDAPGPAETYTFEFSVSDGTNTTDAKYKLKIKDPDADASKSKAPLVPAFDKAQAVVGIPYELTVIVDDRDGDVAVVSVNTDKEPFTRGAMFDATSSTFSWTPTEGDTGEYTVKFKVTDGSEQKTVKLKLKVKSSLLF